MILSGISPASSCTAPRGCRTVKTTHLLYVLLTSPQHCSAHSSLWLVGSRKWGGIVFQCYWFLSFYVSYVSHSVSQSISYRNKGLKLWEKKIKKGEYGFFTSSNQNLEYPFHIHILRPLEYVISSHFPDSHFEMFVNLRPCEAGRIPSFNKQMLIGPLYVLANETYMVSVLLKHKV